MSNENNRLSSYVIQHGSNVLFQNSEGGALYYSDVCQLGSRKPFVSTHRNLVFCLADNDFGGLAGYIALLVADAVPLMLGSTVSLEQMQDLIAFYKPRYIWLPEVRREEMTSAEYLESFEGYCLLDLHNTTTKINDSLALLLGTSGSTGSPKFVRLSHENVLSNAQSIAKYLDLNSEELPVTTLPPSYTYGLSIIHSHILVGATIAVTNKTFFDRNFWSFIRDVKATSISGVPYHYEMLKKLRFNKMDLPSLKTLTQAGGRMEPELTKEYATYCEVNGMRFFTMYGQAEATARMSYLPSEKTVSKAGSIGVAIPGGEFWLEDQNGEVIDKSDMAGELVYQGRNVSMGYANGYEDLTKGDERHGVLRTGDIAKRDKDGYYYIVGRLKRFIKLFGNRINLQDVERFLLDAGHIVACAGQDDCLEIYMPESSDLQAKQIKKQVADYLKVALPGIAVYGIRKLPRNESGKIQYAELQPQNSALLA